MTPDQGDRASAHAGVWVCLIHSVYQLIWRCSFVKGCTVKKLTNCEIVFIPSISTVVYLVAKLVSENATTVWTPPSVLLQVEMQQFL